MPDSSSATASSLVGKDAVVAHNVVGLHKDPDIGSELLSQLVSGMKVRVHGQAADFVLVQGPDRFEGWVRERYVAAARDWSDCPSTTIASLIADVHSSPTADSQILTKLTVSTPVHLGRHSSAREFTPILLPNETTGYTHRANLSSTYSNAINLRGIGRVDSAPPSVKARWSKVMAHAMNIVSGSALRLIGTPYLWGGTTPFGIDCSGLSQLSYRICGIALLRNSSLQIDDKRFGPVEDGAALADAALEAGDLVFFRGRAEDSVRVEHVGLSIGDGSFVHAAGGGRGVIVSACDDPEWSQIYVGARRLLTDADLSIDAA
jgi:cell wall-associated NlpC family hydrolase